MVTTATEKICERCGNVFACNAADIPDCGCSAIKIGAGIESLLSRYRDCLCAKCLQELAAQTVAESDD